MQWWQAILLFLLGVPALLYALGFIIPDTKHVVRRTHIAAPPERVFELISDFQAWERWSPWAGLDPDMTMEITGAGVGHRMSWASDDPKVGNGSQEIIALTAAEHLQTKLSFGEMGGGIATFSLRPDADGTSVEWSLDTNMRDGVPTAKQPMAAYFGFMLDKMVGADYEKGLRQLKEIAETPA